MDRSVIGFLSCFLFSINSKIFQFKKSSSIYIFFVCISFFVLIVFIVCLFSATGFSATGFSAIGMSNKMYSISQCQSSFWYLFLCKYQAFSSSFIPEIVAFSPSLASLHILDTAKSQSSGLLCKYQNNHLAFQEMFGSLSNLFGITQYLFAIFNFGMVL